jgi:hypothetical protein
MQTGACYHTGKQSRYHLEPAGGLTHDQFSCLQVAAQRGHLTGLRQHDCAEVHRTDGTHHSVLAIQIAPHATFLSVIVRMMQYNMHWIFLSSIFSYAMG